MFVVTVGFQLKPGRMDQFLPLMIENANASLTREPGCLQFDVCTNPKRPDEVFLYEVYEDAAAFEEHLASEHFRTLDGKVASWVASKTVTTLERLWPHR